MSINTSTFARAEELFPISPGFAYVHPLSEDGIRYEQMRTASQKEVFETITNDPGGANLPRIHAFASAIGATVRPYIIVDGVTQAAPDWFLLGKPTDGRPGQVTGRYSQDNGMAVINRQGCDDANTERVVVHEIVGHGADYHMDGKIVHNGKLVGVRLGFLTIGTDLKTHGKVWAEGNAEWRAGAYAALTDQAITMDRAYDLSPEAKYNNFLPPKYMSVHSANTHEYLALGPSSFCAGIVDLLGLCDPRIFDTLLRTNHDPEAMVEFAQRVDAISRGLFDYLDILPENEVRLAMISIKNELFGLGGPEASTLAASSDAFFKGKVGNL